ncbi:nicotinate phosphoribosyltransferase [Noviherbaspirillum pedocola]|uniref:Nicotinate phosphoribosyltransferase n=1 Tax=Noviherbaspirillum pedocola TaxID=2801341 RepID=A0A934SXX8_9BURK|nr:nicotinate phosphoribosyltransferase [Noviherbaspirillum pedocola]MBK4737583.1 nicotinate phosphoribosyltransferase [Noviherbaspirillum pedocola]
MSHYTQSALLTDLYEITMMQAYFSEGMNDRAVFEFFVRKLSPARNFLLAAGLEQVVEYLSGLRFDQDDIAWLRACGLFDPGFIESLRDFRFTGDVDAMPEGTVFFENEPVLRISAPLREAQLVESRIINLLHFQTLIASRAARCVIAAGGRQLIDFGLRRAHGAEAGLLSARASHLAGFDGTATAAAATLFGIPVFGTMAHSYIEAHDYETDAYCRFAHAFPKRTTLLIDTYDTEAAARQVVRLARSLRAQAIAISAVRIDSGDLDAVSRRVRAILDEGDCGDIRIFASGNLDEYALQDLIGKGAPIDGFGIGTRMNTSSDAPYLDCAYKLMEYAGQPRCKHSMGKVNLPGSKQVYRRRDGNGVMVGDMLALHDERIEGDPLLKPVMRDGALVAAPPGLQDIRRYAGSQLAGMPAGLRMLGPAQAYVPSVSPGLLDMARKLDAWLRAQSANDRARWEGEAV